MIDLRQMRYFVALGEMLHFGKAAARLNVTQPPLSRQIAALEAELGVRLVIRRPRAIELTEAGRLFLDECRLILARVEGACEMVRRADRGEQGALSVGFMHAAHGVAASLAGRFMAAFPHVALRLRDMLPSALRDEVLAGRVDAGILFAPGPSRHLSTKTVFSERLCCAMPTGHPLARHDVVPAIALKGLPFVASPADIAPSLREAILLYCRDAGFDPAIHMEVQLQQTIVSLVAEGIGIAIVPESQARLGLANATFRPLEDAPSVDTVLAWRSDNPNPALHALRDIAADTGSV